MMSNDEGIFDSSCITGIGAGSFVFIRALRETGALSVNQIIDPDASSPLRKLTVTIHCIGILYVSQF